MMQAGMLCGNCCANRRMKMVVKVMVVRERDREMVGMRMEMMIKGSGFFGSENREEEREKVSEERERA